MRTIRNYRQVSFFNRGERVTDGIFHVGEVLGSYQVVAIYQEHDEGIVYVDAVKVGGSGRIFEYARIPYHAVHILLGVLE